MKDISKLLNKRKILRDHRNSYEFQAYGNRLAEEMGEPHRRTMYIKLAKDEDRNLLELAREFVMRQENATTRGKLFMWKLKQLKEEFEKKALAQATQS